MEREAKLVFVKSDTTGVERRCFAKKYPRRNNLPTVCPPLSSFEYFAAGKDIAIQILHGSGIPFAQVASSNLQLVQKPQRNQFYRDLQLEIW